MKRTTAVLISLVATFAIAFSAIPALASPIDGYTRVTDPVSDPTAGRTAQSDGYRSPEAVLAAAGETSPLPSPSVQGSSDEAFDWGDAGIGAAAMLGLLGLGTGALLVSGRPRRRTATS